MSLSHLVKLISSSPKYHNQLVRFSSALILNTKFRVFFPVRCACALRQAESQVASRFPNLRAQYIINNADKYKMFKIEDINLMKENFESLKLLSNFVNSAESGSSEEEIPENLKTCIRNEIQCYGLEDILKFIVLCSKIIFRLGTSSKQELLQILDGELYTRIYEPDAALKILFTLKLCFPRHIYEKRLKSVYKYLNRIIRRIYNLSAEQVVLYFFSSIVPGREILRTCKFNLQDTIIKVLPKLCAEELWILARGMHDMGLKLNNPDTISGFIQQTLNEIENMDNFSFTWICKMIDFNNGPLNFENVVQFQERMLPHTSKFDNVNLILLATTGTDLRYVNKTLWEIVSNKIKEELRESPQSVNSKSLVRLVNLTTKCNIRDEELLKLSVEKLETEDIQNQYNHVVLFCYHLIHHQIYPEKLLTSLFSQNFRSEYIEKLNFCAHHKYCYLSSCIELDKPTHNFELLDSDEKEKFYKIFTIIPSLEKASKSCYKSSRRMKQSLCQLYGDSLACLTRVLPHGNYGVLMRFNKNFEPQQIPEEFTLLSNSCKRALVDDHFWVFIVIFSSADFTRDFETLTFVNHTQIRQMKELGFIPFVVKDFLWRREVKENTEQEYIKNDIIENIKKLIQEKSQNDGASST